MRLINEYKGRIAEMLSEDPSKWESLRINLRKPHTYRAWRILDERKGLRLCLHRFEPCFQQEAFCHPHPWPAEFLVLAGGYYMDTGRAVKTMEPSLGGRGPDRIEWSMPYDVNRTFLTAGSWYEMREPGTFHSVQPVKQTYSIMINGEPYSHRDVHPEAPTTKDKNLNEMNRFELQFHLDSGKYLFKKWMRGQP